MSELDEGYIRNAWANLMKVISETHERTWWRLYQKHMSEPDEGYIRNTWANLMKVISETHERTWWRLYQKHMSEPDEGYLREVQKHIAHTKLDIYVFSWRIQIKVWSHNSKNDRQYIDQMKKDKMLYNNPQNTTQKIKDITTWYTGVPTRPDVGWILKHYVM
jgi:predicted metal-dependent phosphoesterase TrpH